MKRTPPTRVLIVDDDPDLRETLAELLEDEGFEPVVANTPARAVALLGERDVQAVTTDLRFRGVVQGLDSLAELRATAGPVPVGLVTTAPFDLREVRAAGFSFYLAKPFDAADYVSAIARATGPREVSAARRDAISAYFAALGTHDWSKLKALCAADVKYHLPGTDTEFCTTITGRDAFGAFSEQVFSRFRDAHFTVRELLGLPYGAVARYHGSWRDPDGTPRELPGSVVFRFGDDDLLSEIGIRLVVKQIRQPPEIEPAPGVH